MLPGPRASVDLHRALDLRDRGEPERATALLGECARRVTPAAGFPLWEKINGHYALLLLRRGETAAAAAGAEAAGDPARLFALGEELAALPDTGRSHEKAAALGEIAAACARAGDRERAAGYCRASAELFRRAQAYRHAERARERLTELLEMRD
ncbi:hypothetical protein [Streptomyces platensis]|uniref:hypothetical protein n=1 Tax=Streptomyces platensis TaxID=58346 RepID=UPI002E802DE6|nr:hypothetical protein [Streptomyces platensis]WUB81158.1 hypothetical protein OG424_19390 [Streptomyces platensis]